MNLIKKYIHQILDKWIVTIATAALITFGSAIFGTIKVFSSMPKELQGLRDLHTQDSTRAANFIMQNNQRIQILELRVETQEQQIVRLQKTNERIKSKLHIK